MARNVRQFRLTIAAALVAIVAMAAPCSSQVQAQTPNATGNEFQTQTQGKTVVGVMNMCLNSSNQAVPCSGGGGGGTPISVSGFDSGPVPATCTGTPCVANSSHAAGTSVGGLYTMPLARVAGGSGILTGLQYISLGASVGQYVLRAWTKLPQSTCTDNVAFANNAADDPFLLNGTPISLTPAAPAVATGDARTYAPLSVVWDYKNNDTVPSQNLYFCIQTVLTNTADENSSPELMASGIQN